MLQICVTQLIMYTVQYNFTLKTTWIIRSLQYFDHIFLSLVFVCMFLLFFIKCFHPVSHVPWLAVLGTQYIHKITNTQNIIRHQLQDPTKTTVLFLSLKCRLANNGMGGVETCASIQYPVPYTPVPKSAISYHEARSVENMKDLRLASVITGSPSLVSATFLTVSVPGGKTNT